MTQELQTKDVDISESVAVAGAAQEEATTMLMLIEAFKVETPEEFLAANDELIAIKKKINEYEKKRKDMKAPVLEAGRKIDELFKPAIEVLQKAEKAIKSQMITWQREQERIRREAEEIARKELEKAERARIKAIEKGDVAKVAKLEEKVATVATQVAAAPTIPTAKGFYITDVWSANIVDFMALVKAVAAGKQPITLLCPNQGELDDLAKAHKENLSVPGVLAVKRDSAGSRAK